MVIHIVHPASLLVLLRRRRSTSVATGRRSSSWGVGPRDTGLYLSGIRLTTDEENNTRTQASVSGEWPMRRTSVKHLTRLDNTTGLRVRSHFLNTVPPPMSVLLVGHVSEAFPFRGPG